MAEQMNSRVETVLDVGMGTFTVFLSTYYKSIEVKAKKDAMYKELRRQRIMEFAQNEG